MIFRHSALGIAPAGQKFPVENALERRQIKISHDEEKGPRRKEHTGARDPRRRKFTREKLKLLGSRSHERAKMYPRFVCGALYPQIEFYACSHG